jgi:hypothetical protein
MKSSWIRCIGVCVIATATVLSLSCGQEQRLVSITVTPAHVDFFGAGAQFQMQAMGNYIHPPATKDITRTVTWASNDPGGVTMTQTGLATSINICGFGQITATAYSNPANPPAGSAIQGSADFDILLNGSPNCSQLANLTVTIGGGVGGNVASSPGGITCPSVCSNNFAVGTTVTLTAQPSGGGTFSTWSGCDSTSGNICVVTMSAARTITANFI